MPVAYELGAIRYTDIEDKKKYKMSRHVKKGLVILWG
jgi:hypothetical protein